MLVVTLWWFSSPTGARTAVDLLQEGSVELHDAVVLSWPPERPCPGAVRFGRPRGEVVLAGAYWGLLLGLPLVPPVVGSVVGAGVGLLVACATRPLLLRDAVRDARRCLTEGTSVLVLLSEQAPVGHLLDRLVAPTMT